MSVRFDLSKNQTFDMYSNCEYNRYPIDSILYLRCYRKVSDTDWRTIMDNLNYYKTTEMIVHRDSVHNTRLH